MKNHEEYKYRLFIKQEYKLNQAINNNDINHHQRVPFMFKLRFIIASQPQHQLPLQLWIHQRHMQSHQSHAAPAATFIPRLARHSDHVIFI